MSRKPRIFSLFFLRLAVFFLPFERRRTSLHFRTMFPNYVFDISDIFLRHVYLHDVIKSKHSLTVQTFTVPKLQRKEKKIYSLLNEVKISPLVPKGTRVFSLHSVLRNFWYLSFSELSSAIKQYGTLKSAIYAWWWLFREINDFILKNAVCTFIYWSNYSSDL